MKIITNPVEIPQEKWLKFIANHPEGNIFQTPFFYELNRLSSEHKEFGIFVLNNNDEILALLVGSIIYERKPIIKQLSKRSIIIGGPLYIKDQLEALNQLLKAYILYINSEAIYTEFRQVGYMQFDIGFHISKFEKEARINFLFDLSKNEEELFQNLHPIRRRQINRGYKRGVKTIVLQNNSEVILKECYTILESLYNSIKLPVPSIAYFKNSLKILGPHLKIFLAYLDNEIIGFRFVLLFKNLIYDWYAASKKDFYEKYPNDILPWEVIKWGSANGYKIFDFGGAGKPNEDYGVRDYKAKFGGQLIETHRIRIIHKPIKMKVVSKSFKILRNLLRQR